MSGKRFNPLENPPAASSSDEDDFVETSIGEGDEVVESSSEEEDDDASSGNPSVKKPVEKNQVSDSESGSDEETDSDNETERKAPVKNPASSAVKSVAVTKDSAAAKSQDSKKVKSSSKSATKKRPSETDVADAKRVKRVSGEDEKKSGEEEETKKTPFTRVWTEDDEITVLQGFIDYEADAGASPFVNSTAFYESVKKSISFDVKKTQVMEKVRGLKKKFENNRSKGKDGEDPKFAKPHDRKAFDLSKIIWGDNGLFPESAMKSNGKSKKSSKPSKEELISSLLNGKSCEDEVAANIGEELVAFAKPVLVTSLARFGGVDDLAAQQGWSRLASEDKKRFEEEWKQLQLKEFEFYSQRSGFFHGLVTKMAETFRPST